MSDRLSEIEARLATATPGPWEPSCALVDMSTHEHEYGVITAREGDTVCDVPWDPRDMEGPHGTDAADAALIAHAPADLADLVKFAREVEGVLSEKYPADGVHSDEAFLEFEQARLDRLDAAVARLGQP